VAQVIPVYLPVKVAVVVVVQVMFAQVEIVAM